jgi:twitching motility protein PilI
MNGPTLMKAVDALARRFERVDSDAAAERRKTERRFRGLRVGNLGLLVAHDCSGELIEDAQVHPLPGAPPWCRGLINLRGRLLPAFDLHEPLGVTRFRAQRQWWLALGTGDDAFAFPIDALPVSLVADEAAAVEVTVVPQSVRPHTPVSYRIGGELWLEFRHRDFIRALCASSGPCS